MHSNNHKVLVDKLIPENSEQNTESHTNSLKISTPDTIRTSGKTFTDANRNADRRFEYIGNNKQ